MSIKYEVIYDLMGKMFKTVNRSILTDFIYAIREIAIYAFCIMIGYFYRKGKERNETKRK